MLNANPCGQANNISATTDLGTSPRQLLGIFVASASNTPTIKVESGAAVIVNTFVPAVGWHFMPFECVNGIQVTIGGTVDCTVSSLPL
jgi:hypothetical protein